MKLEKEDIIKEYKIVLSGGKRWGNGYWNDFEGKEKARICIRYMAEEILKLNDEDYRYRLCKQMFVKNKLSNMLKVVYRDSIEDAFCDAVPEKADLVTQRKRRYEIKMDIAKMMKKDIDTKCIASKVIEYLDCPEKDIPSTISEYIIQELGLCELIENLYKGSYYAFINEVKPNVFNPWEYENCHLSYYRHYLTKTQSPEIPECYFSDKNNRKRALEWALKKLGKDENISSLTDSDLHSIGLKTLFEYYNRNIFSLLDEFYPYQTRPWLCGEEGSRDYWIKNDDICKEAVEYLLNKLNITKENILELKVKDFTENNLSNLLYYKYNGLIYNAVNSIYVGKIENEKWLFDGKPEELFHNKENRIEATKCLINKLDLNHDNLLNSITVDDFKNNNLECLLKYYKGNLYEVLSNCLDGWYSIEEYKNAGMNTTKYLDIFKDCNFKKLSFENETEDKIKEGLKKLSGIFSVNRNSWRGVRKPIPFVQELGELEVFIYKELLKENITIYEFNIKEPDEPKTKKEERIFNVLWEHSKAKYMNIALLYWRAYNFFKENNLYLQLNSVFMNLDVYNHVEEYVYKYYRCEHKKTHVKTITQDLEETFQRYNSKVRCGELEVYRFIYELQYNTDYFWVFPFDDNFEPGEDISIYLIESSNEFRSAIKAFFNRIPNKKILI